MKPAFFRAALLGWYDEARRDLPWRESTDFYRVWISEVMLQQTRVEAVVPYYLRFLERFPDVEALARADEPEVLTAWSGLGYYSRARNLHGAAKLVAGAGVPSSYEALRELPGVGEYTAAAVASIALGLAHAAVDGNVIRVLSRIDNDPTVISAPGARRRFAERAEELLDRKRPGDFNQAMMELGARVCTPRSPDCGNCPVARFCAARAAGTERELPMRPQKPLVRDETRDLVVLQRGDEIWLVERGAEEKRLAGFWELPERRRLPRGVKARKAAEFAHRIVNDRYRIVIWNCAAPPNMNNPSEGKWIPLSELDGIPITTVTRKALDRTKKQRG